jgi:hypothetical protein
MLDLSNVVLCTMATRDHRAVRSSIDRCLSAAHFGGVLVFTDRCDWCEREWDVRHVDPFPGLGEPAISEWGLTEGARALAAIPGSHALSIHWDGFIVNTAAWEPSWLGYDYIGAPWDDGLVGNNGFGLTSRRFWQAVADLRLQPGECWPGDVVLCRHEYLGRRFPQRARLDKAGMRYAPAEVARRFSVENEEYTGSFGFHGTKTLVSVIRQGLL